MKRALILGFVLWLVATAVLRFAPARLLRADDPGRILLLYGASFILFFSLVRRALAPEPGAPSAAAALRSGIALFLPTLVLDALASAFFPLAYPNFGTAANRGGVPEREIIVCD